MPRARTAALAVLLALPLADALMLQHCRTVMHAPAAALQQRRHSAVRADESSFFAMFDTPPILFNRMEVFDEGKGVILNPVTGITVTPSGYLGLFFILIQQLFAPWGYVKYMKRLREDEQAWLDLGKSPEQAVINAYNNQRPPPKPEVEDGAEDGADGSSAADASAEAGER